MHPLPVAIAAVVITTSYLLHTEFFRDTYRFTLCNIAIATLLPAVIFSDRYYAANWVLRLYPNTKAWRLELLDLHLARDRRRRDRRYSSAVRRTCTDQILDRHRRIWSILHLHRETGEGIEGTIQTALTAPAATDCA